MAAPTPPFVSYDKGGDYNTATGTITNFSGYNAGDSMFFGSVGAYYGGPSFDNQNMILVDYYSPNISSFLSNAGEPLTPNYGGYDINFSDNTNQTSLYGGDFADIIEGGTGTNTLSGLGGDDTLIGGAGVDHAEGGSGTNTVSYQHSKAEVDVGLQTGGFGGDAAGDTYVSIQNIRGGSGNDFLFGDTGDNVIEGGAGADVINGLGGDDTASYQHSSAAVSVNLATGVNTGGDARGDKLFNIGNLLGGAYDDKLVGNGDANVLMGGGGNDILFGGDGDDTIEGDAGSDRLHGGGGNNVFAYKALSDSTVAGRDVIEDFVQGSGKIDLSAIDANSTIDGAQHFTFNATGRFSHVAGELIARIASHSTVIYGDGNGDGAADFAISLRGVFTLTADDFKLS